MKERLEKYVAMKIIICYYRNCRNKTNKLNEINNNLNSKSLPDKWVRFIIDKIDT
ncbi:hypothetical protein [Clostridium estertheticum]|uniref:Uncharacterized protein n=1 Tax=Clostridium estertheticum TaxID=238834 RepID=A0AA47EJD0_9CLOT|nr:hypothetical protein [Clostridium estertheticum]MBU3153923.1 hypothetical protein [Clostridium estertheticum]WAG61303.1 hypothetical protein LL038_03355 [Clostridium estertheticum]